MGANGFYLYKKIRKSFFDLLFGFSILRSANGEKIIERNEEKDI